MVSFTPNSFVIEFGTSGEPFEDWIALQDELYELLHGVDPDLRGDSNYYHVYRLLKELLPTWEQARRMNP